jgi:hypothetical protein
VRRGLTWVLVLPAIAAGSQVAHAIAYWWAYPQASLRLAELAESGHGYLAYAPAAVAFLGAAQVIGFAGVVLDRLRGRPAGRVPAWAFLLVPELGFVLQEHLERFIAAGTFPWWTVLEPSFWRGLILQIPLGVAAYLAARILLRTAEKLADAVGARRAPPLSSHTPVAFLRPANVFLPRRAPLASLAADRAPPLLAC